MSLFSCLSTRNYLVSACTYILRASRIEKQEHVLYHVTFGNNPLNQKIYIKDILRDVYNVEKDMHTS